jgi:hypothetical protein
VGRNGKQSPARPRIEVRQPASPEEAAAIAAAIEQFMRDTAPPPASPGPQLSPWLRAGLLEGTKRTWGETGSWGYGDSPR